VIKAPLSSFDVNKINETFWKYIIHCVYETLLIVKIKNNNSNNILENFLSCKKNDA
jgi:hypothetical protein